MKNRFLLSFLFIVVFFGCADDSIPKPQGYLRLDYPIARYDTYAGDYPFTFGKNIYADIKSKRSGGFNIEYPHMKASIYLSYKHINNDLDSLLTDAQRLTYKHSKRAETILEYPFVNPDDKVYGMLYDVGGNAASSTQFYITDSLNHFIFGSVYFNVKPNFDSILPASEYIKNDVRVLIESFKWEGY